MRVVVTDVSVLFDLYAIGKLTEFFKLDWEIIITDFVYNEILRSDQRKVFEKFIRSGNLIILRISSKEVMEIIRFKTRLSIRSIADRTILWKALQLDATLLTCDKKLRKEAEGHDLEVRGSIWVITELVDKGIVNKTEGRQLLENLKTKNDRLPVERIDEQIKKWNQ